MSRTWEWSLQTMHSGYTTLWAYIFFPFLLHYAIIMSIFIFINLTCKIGLTLHGSGVVESSLTLYIHLCDLCMLYVCNILWMLCSMYQDYLNWKDNGTAFSVVVIIFHLMAIIDQTVCARPISKVWTDLRWYCTLPCACYIYWYRNTKGGPHLQYLLLNQ